MKNIITVIGLTLLSYQLVAQQDNIESQFCSYLKENTSGGMNYIGGTSCLPRDIKMLETIFSTAAYNEQSEGELLDENFEPLGTTETLIVPINFIIDEKIKYRLIKGENNGSIIVNANRYVRDENGYRIKSQNFDLVFEYTHTAADSMDVKFELAYVQPRVPVTWKIVENKMVIVDSDPLDNK